nr:hypothetical protein [uncultured Tolumonas sp.]
MSHSNEKASEIPNPQQDAKIILMNIGETQSSFHKSSESDNITLPVGYSAISNRYFKHTPPTYDDIEYAINYIEDEIEKVVPKIPASGFTLVTNDAFIHMIARLSGCVDAPEIQLQRDDLEYLFGQYAGIAMGRPPRPHETDISPQFYAQLLILREFMHHLKFDHIVVKQVS